MSQRRTETGTGDSADSREVPESPAVPESFDDPSSSQLPPSPEDTGPPEETGSPNDTDSPESAGEPGTSETADSPDDADSSGSSGSAEDQQRSGSETRTQIRAMLTTLGIDLVAPLAVFYGLRAFGVGDVLALLLGVLLPAIRSAYLLVSQKRFDAFAVFVLTTLVLAVLISFWTGSARFLLAKDGWLTGIAGLWILGTLVTRRAFCYLAVRTLLPHKRAELEAERQRSARFRRVWTVLTAVWGCGLFGDAAVRVVIAYTLPIDLVPVLGSVQYFVLYALLQGITVVYLRRTRVLVPVLGEPRRRRKR